MVLRECHTRPSAAPTVAWATQLDSGDVFFQLFSRSCGGSLVGLPVCLGLRRSRSFSSLCDE